MAYRVVVTEQFRNDVLAVVGYLKNELGSPNAASRLVDSIDNALSLIGEMPYMYAVSTKPRLGMFELRECFVQNYVIVYGALPSLASDADGDVHVLRLFHQTQDFERLL